MSNCSAATLPSFVALSNIDRTSTGPFGGSLNGGNTTQVCGFNPYFLPSWSNLTSCCSTPVYNVTSSSDNSTISSSCGLSCIAFCGYEEPRTTHLGFSDCLFGGGEIPNNWQAQCFTVNSPGDTTGSCGTNASTTIVMPIVSPTPTPVSSTALSNTSTMSTAASSQQSASWLSPPSKRNISPNCECNNDKINVGNPNLGPHDNWEFINFQFHNETSNANNNAINYTQSKLIDNRHSNSDARLNIGCGPKYV